MNWTIIEPLKPFNTIGADEIDAVEKVMLEGTLSGFLGGELRGGKHVRAIEDAWCMEFGVKHAVACNSATSGLLAACSAVGVEQGDDVIVPALTMSASAAAPALLGAKVRFAEIDKDTFCSVSYSHVSHARAWINTNLFGHPGYLAATRQLYELHGVKIIEDNAQSPFAMENGKYAGTVGHIGVFSLNVHKALQAGEGGICVTDDDALADHMRRFINHGEMAGSGVGLNLRMTEITAAIGLVQLRKARQIIGERVEIAQAIIEQIKGIPGITPPTVRENCKHVYYAIAIKVDGDRKVIASALRDAGVPIREGYVDPLYRLPAFRKSARPCPVAEEMHDQRLMLYENCAYTPTNTQIRQIGDAFRKVMESQKEHT